MNYIKTNAMTSFSACINCNGTILMYPYEIRIQSIYALPMHTIFNTMNNESNLNKDNGGDKK